MAGGRCIATFSQVVDDISITANLPVVQSVRLTCNFIEAYLGGLVRNNMLKCVDGPL